MPTRSSALQSNAPRLTPVDRRTLERTMLRLLRERDAGKTICPSDVARAVAAERFRPLMPAVRAVAAKLVLRGVVEITQRGEVVSLAEVRGPIRIRLRAPSTPR